MFKYDDTGEQSNSYEKPVKVVTKKRPKTYENVLLFKNKKKITLASHLTAEIDRLVQNGYKKIKTIESQGWEIEKELKVDPKGPNKDLIK